MKLALIGLASTFLINPNATTIDAYVRSYIERTDLPGAIVTVTQGKQVVLAKGYGHTAAGDPITASTPMPLASLSKSFTAEAVLSLKLDLDAPVRRYLPEFTMADPRAAKITVRQLLQQTSGMSDKTYPELTLPAPDTLKQAVANLRTAKLATDPGAKFSYHNPNYAVAARLVEVVSGRPYADYLRERVLRPLGMNATTTVDTTRDLPGQGAGYVRAYGLLIKRDHPKWFVNGAFGVVSTADDLGRWLIAQNHPTPTMRTAQTGNMGWFSEKTKVSHSGWLLTHNSMQTLLKNEKYGVAVVTNTSMISGDDARFLSDGIIDLLENRSPAESVPFTTTVDPWLFGLSVLNLALGTVGVFRSGRRRSLWRLVPYALPILFFVFLTDVAAVVMNRVGTMEQLTYVWLALYGWAATAALAAAAVVIARTAAWLRRRSAGSRSPRAARGTA